MTCTRNIMLQEPFSVFVPGYGNVLLRRGEIKEAKGLLPVRLKTDEGELTLHEFALPLIDSRPNSTEYWPLIHCAIGDRDAPFVAVLGLMKITFISPKAEVTVEHSLGRDRNDDWGFFRTELVPCAIGCALATESVLIRLSPQGHVLWQLPLTLHDHLIHFSDRFLHFGSDEFSKYKDGHWFVDLEDGKILLQESMPMQKWIFPSTDE
jgi:hypothetical protein